MAKTISVGGKNYKAGSKRADAAIASGGSVGSKIQGTSRGASEYRDEQGVLQTDAITAAENAGVKIPEKIEPGQMPEEIAAFEQPVATPPIPAKTTAKANLKAVTPPQSPQVQSITPPTPPNRFQQAYETIQASGTPPPTSAGAARGILANTIQPVAPTTAFTQLTETDPFFADLQKSVTEFLNPKKQRESLTQEYQRLTKQSGIDELDTELMDMRNVIDGTEDDIRNEITKAGGFATESQVQALTNSRNKQLIKNYNNLLQTRELKQNHLDTMIQLSKEDRQLASQEFDQRFNIVMQMQDYKMRMQENARQGYDRIVAQVGYAGLQQMTGGDPYYTSLVEKTLGLGEGGLSQLASIVDEEKELNLELKREQIATERAQRSNIYSQIDARNNPVQKPPTQKQYEIAGFTDRLKKSNKTINNLGSMFTGGGSYVGEKLPTILKSSERQLFEQAQRDFINAVLRRESGATITADEFDNARQQYFPVPGNTPEVLEAKRQNREIVINSYAREAANVVGSNTITAPDGTEIEIID